MLKKLIVFLCMIVLMGTAIYWFAFKDDSDKHADSNINTTEPLHSIEAKQGTKFKTCTAQEFSDLYNGFAYPNTQQIINDFSITGDEEADQVIYDLAEDAGYRIRSAPVTNNFVNIGNSQLLQRLAAEDWNKLNKQALADGIKLKVSEGFRAADDQNNIFAGRLGSLSTEKIIDRSSDDKIKQLLKTTAPPGYSRHHSGYTIDLVCVSDPGVLFKDSECFKWISGNNYINIKKSGWIPSYPEGIENQGPEPESWEYVWVGLDAVKE